MRYSMALNRESGSDLKICGLSMLSTVHVELIDGWKYTSVANAKYSGHSCDTDRPIR